MIKLQRVLVPTDFSNFSQHSMRYGCEFARKFGAELHLLNVVEDLYPIIPEPGVAAASPGDYLLDLEKSATRALQLFPKEEWAEGLEITRTVLSGTPFLEVIRYAKRNDIDMIVIGTHGRTGLIHALMGSVAEKIVRKSPCPVLTVRPEGHDFVMP